MTAAACGTCGTGALRDDAKFCDECGAPIAQAHKVAEYKQVTVLFADVVHSMQIAAAVGAERLREIMTELVNRATVVVERYGGTVAQFTGELMLQLARHRLCTRDAGVVRVLPGARRLEPFAGALHRNILACGHHAGLSIHPESLTAERAALRIVRFHVQNDHGRNRGYDCGPK